MGRQATMACPSNLARSDKSRKRRQPSARLCHGFHLHARAASHSLTYPKKHRQQWVRQASIQKDPLQAVGRPQRDAEAARLASITTKIDDLPALPSRKNTERAS
jgi:hypothetical protein